MLPTDKMPVVVVREIVAHEKAQLLIDQGVDFVGSHVRLVSGTKDLPRGPLSRRVDDQAPRSGENLPVPLVNHLLERDNRILKRGNA